MTIPTDLQGTEWQGDSELWLDPLGDQVQRSPCTIKLEGDTVHYTWIYKDEPHQGSIRLLNGGADGDGGAEFTDTWHQPEPMKCNKVADGWGLFQVLGTYGPESDWGWRIGLCVRTPTGELVLQMTNIAPWGEEARAVRMVCARK